MAMWNPWRGCRKYSDGCKFCYIHKGDSKRSVDTNLITKTKNFEYPIKKLKNGEYKLKSNQMVYLCFSTDFLIEEADSWREECWKIIKERQDLNFLFLTKRIDRFLDCIPTDWNDGYDNMIVGCTIENQRTANYRLNILKNLPIKHKNIICQPLIENIEIEKYLDDVELVVVGGESDYNARPLNYDWVLNIRKQCLNKNVNFEFRQCGTNFIKDNKLYKLNTKILCSQAKKANINFIAKSKA
ncbi:DUF5131 family protein [Miniphocaeibacter massiliensis]|uniref:DUF5131 family protein n=1 Tax=Miniphocaeibacter massiliensis TaxID=2041841 RepID=UPI000C1B86BA|nr:DUF5131 family protein [Miniphocaeibacter massiliensis]